MVEAGPTPTDCLQERDSDAATAEILRLIRDSRGDEQPVFDAILRHAQRLCGSPTAALVLARASDPHPVLVAHRGVTDEVVALYDAGAFTMDPRYSFTAQAVTQGRTVHVNDMAESAAYREGQSAAAAIVERLGIRTNLFVPLMAAEGGIGCIIVFRDKVRPYSSEQIALVERFAAQAVIAIENARQFRELQQRLEREAAMREILEVINSSRDDEQPIFEAILKNALRLCRTKFGYLSLVDGEGTHLEIVTGGAASLGPHRPGWRFPIESDILITRSFRERRVLHLEDITADALYRAGEPNRLITAEAGVRTLLAVPLVDGEQAIGAIGLYRTEVRAFSEGEIDLMQTFASQAVIAIENARQFRALAVLNAELEDRVRAQVGEIERMGRLKRFMPAAVADAVVSSGSDRLLSSHRALLGVLFCDIRGFTAFCETAEPEETIEVLQTYHEEMGKLIAGHGAGVDHRMGDGIMVLFNDPLPCEDPAGEAVRLALAMRARMTDLCRDWKRLGHKLGFGVGVSLGYATVGMVGYEGRFDYTASGTAVNLAARLCDEAQNGEILLSPRAGAAVEGDFVVAARGAINLKGMREAVEVYRIADPT